MVEQLKIAVDAPRGRGRPKNGALIENSLWRLEEIIRVAAVNHDRLPSAEKLADKLHLPTAAMAYAWLNLGARRGLWRLIRSKVGFIEVLGIDGSWRTATYEEWIKKKIKPRKCLSCRKEFSPKSKYRFLCDACNAAI